MKKIKYKTGTVNKLIKYVGNNFSKPLGVGGIITTKIMNIINQNMYKTVINNLIIEPENNILDIGFGNGYLIKKLFQKNIPIKMYGLEISKDMVNKVSSKCKKYVNNGSLMLLLENIEKTSLENDLLDKIVTINTFYFWNDYEKCFSEIKRILKNNGLFFNTVYSKDYLDKLAYTKYGFKKHTIDEIKKLTVQNGMEIIETIEISKNKAYCLISRKQSI